MFPSHKAPEAKGVRHHPQPLFHRECLMQQLTQSGRSPGREPAAAIPKFRKIGLSAVAAACAWERRPLAPRREGAERKPLRSE
jgi:hypothetical protein